jgi:hypothetical protein
MHLKWRRLKDRRLGLSGLFWNSSI